MRVQLRWASVTLVLVLFVAPAAVAQSEPADEPHLPVLDGLAWHRSIDLNGTEIEATRPEAEVSAWSTMLEGAGGTFSDLDYAFFDAFDPSTLPRLGSLATVRVAGAETSALRTAVVEDIVAQAVGLGAEPPSSEETTLAGKDVAVLDLPPEMGFENAIVYASGDVAWILLMSLPDATHALEQLP